MKTEHLLIYRFSALGDVAMLVPVVGALAKQYPELRITVLSRPWAKAFFESLAPNVNFMAADPKKEYQGLHGLNKLYRRLEAKHFTAVADMHDVLRTKYLRWLFCLNGHKVKHIDKHRSGKRQLARKTNKVIAQQPTSFQNYADVLSRLGYPIHLDFQSIFPTSGGDLSLLPEAFRQKPANERWIGIAPFAAHKGKIYPIEKLCEALKIVSQTDNHARFFFFCGGASEHAVIDQLCKELPNSVNASAQLGGIRNELILMSHLDVMLSMDSGNMHLASMTGCRVVSIWGATHPLAGFMGWNQKETDALQVQLNCRPCSVYGNKPCYRGDYACLNQIKPSTIAQKLLE